MNPIELKFLRVKTEKHPTTGTTLEYLQHHHAVAVLILNFNEDKTLLVSGGVAKNRAIISFLEKEYEKVIPLEASDYIGAIGSCFYGKLKA